MNTCDILATGAVELYFYGELTADERRAIDHHLAACGECRDALAELHAIGTALAAGPVVTAPPGGDWTSLMSRIEQAVAREPARLAVAPPARARAWHRPAAAYLAMAALLTLVTSSLAYLAVERHRTPAAAPAFGASPAAPAPQSARAPGAAVPVERFDSGFAAVSEQHFERSKLVILGLATRDPQTSSSSDWAYERQLAGTLLDDTRLYKQAAEARGLGALAGVMSDLEIVLLQTSLADQRDQATLDRLQRLIRKRDLVSKMELSRFF